jgi:HD-like signal output (HDOD) protein
MSIELLRCATAVRKDNNIVPFEELLSSDTLLAEVGKAVCQKGWPWRFPDELRQELLRMHARWKKQKFMSEDTRELVANTPSAWIDESEDEDDLFMPSSKARSVASSKGKSAASTEDDDDDDFMPSSKAKRAASSKGKKVASSKGKSAASTEDDDDDFMPSSKAKRAASSKFNFNLI